jgi:uncharacterized protein
MGATPSFDPIGSALFGKTQRAVLNLLYTHPDQSFYVREIVRYADLGFGAVERELKKLLRGGLIKRSRRGNQVYYAADRSCPVFPDLRNLIVKSSGVAAVIRTALEPLRNRIHVALIFGSVARGYLRNESDVDVLMVGEADFGEIASALYSTQEQLQREVNPVVYPEAEFRDKIAENHHFVASVLREPKIFLIGDEDELARLGRSWVAGSALSESQ